MDYRHICGTAIFHRCVFVLIYKGKLILAFTDVFHSKKFNMIGSVTKRTVPMVRRDCFDKSNNKDVYQESLGYNRYIG